MVSMIPHECGIRNEYCGALDKMRSVV